jgi:hypothetical protein
MTSPRLVNYINHLIEKGQVQFVWRGTPCASWSLARRGPAGTPGGPLRSLQHLFGHPDALARPHDHAKIIQGNRTMQATASVLRACLRSNAPCVLENPCGSPLFRVRPIAALCRHPQATPHVCDFCQYENAHFCLCRPVSKLALFVFFVLSHYEMHTVAFAVRLSCLRFLCFPMRRCSSLLCYPASSLRPEKQSKATQR